MSRGWTVGHFVALQYLDDAPLLLPREGATLLDQDLVAEGADVGLVVGFVLFATPKHLLVERMYDGTFDAHDDGLVHSVADDDAGALLAGHG